MFRPWLIGIIGVIALIAVAGQAIEQAQVTMPYAELEAMQRELADLQKELADLRQESRPLAANLAAALYAAEPRGEALDLVVSLHVNASGKGEVSIPLFDRRAIIVEATLPPALGLVTGENGSSLRVTAAGNWVARLRLAVAAERNQATFGVPRAGAAAVRLTLPGTGAAGRISPSGGENRRVEGGRTVIEAAVPPTEELTIEWSAGATTAATGPEGRLYLRQFTAVTVEPQALRGRTLLRYTIQNGVAREFTVALDGDSVVVLEARGAAVAGWEPARLGERQAIRIRPPTPITGQAEIFVDWEAPIGLAATADIPRLTGLGVEREAGTIGVATGEGVEVESLGSERLTPVETAEAPDDLKALSDRPLALAARYSAEGWRQTISIRRPEAVAVVAARIEEMSGRTVALASGRALTYVRARVRNSTVENLDVTLPAGARLLNAAVDGRLVRPMRGDTSAALRLPLVRSGSAEGGGSVFDVELVYLTELGRTRLFGAAAVEPPVCSLDIGTLRWGVTLPEDGCHIYSPGDLLRDLFERGGWRRYKDKDRSEDPFAVTDVASDQLGFPRMIKGMSLAWERTALDANKAAPGFSAWYALPTFGRCGGAFVFVAALVLGFFIIRWPARRTAGTAVLLILITIVLQWVFGGALSRLVYGFVTGLVLAGLKKFLRPRSDN